MKKVTGLKLISGLQKQLSHAWLHWDINAPVRSITDLALLTVGVTPSPFQIYKQAPNCIAAWLWSTASISLCSDCLSFNHRDTAPVHLISQLNFLGQLGELDLYHWVLEILNLRKENYLSRNFVPSLKMLQPADHEGHLDNPYRRHHLTTQYQ